jgi:hypothetical protein
MCPMMARCIALDIDCAAICRLSAGAMARDSEICAPDRPGLRRHLQVLRRRVRQAPPRSSPSVRACLPRRHREMHAGGRLSEERDLPQPSGRSRADSPHSGEHTMMQMNQVQQRMNQIRAMARTVPFQPHAPPTHPATCTVRDELHRKARAARDECGQSADESQVVRTVDDLERSAIAP